MAYYYNERRSSIFDLFSLNPLPYPVLLIMAVMSIFLGMSWYFSYEEAVEAAEETMGWALLAVPVVLIFIVRWLSSMENHDMFFGWSPWDKRGRRYYGQSSEGSSPWGVAALIVLLLILLQYQSVFLDGWFG